MLAPMFDTEMFGYNIKERVLIKRTCRTSKSVRQAQIKTHLKPSQGEEATAAENMFLFHTILAH